VKKDLHTRHGGKILADALVAQGVKMAFGVPGESYLPLLDGLRDVQDRVKLVVTRQEGGASYMAEAYGKLTGEPGVLLVTRGPGATNGSVGVHTGFQDSTPMVMLIGQVGNEMMEREAFQEIDYRRMFGQMAKWVAQIDRVERIPEYVSHAFHTAMAGRPGPVVLALPEDMLFSDAAVADVARHHVVRAAPAPADMAALKKLLEGAKQPLAILGGGGWTREATKKFQAWAEAHGLPVGTSFRCQDLFDNRSPAYAGDVGIGLNPKLAQRVKEADVLLVVGARLGEMTTSAYTLLDVPQPRQALIHVHAGAEELGRVYRPALAINSGYAQFVDALPALQKNFKALSDAAHAEYLEWIAPRPMPGAVQYGEIIHRRRRRRQLRELAAPAFPVQGLPHPARADERLDGLRLPGRGGGEARRAAAQRARDLRRRRLPHERPGAGDRRAVRGELRRRGGQQRPLRHDPHAPGARVPGARLRHRPAQPGFRRLCPRLWRPRRDGGSHGRLRAGVRAGKQIRKAGTDRAEDRP
jgi:acetolactate synthase-1/2/3 large subunit